MPQFEYCPPFVIFNGSMTSVKPVMETHSLKGALEGVRTRANCRLSVSILVTEGDTSTLVPVTLDVADLKDMPIEDVRQMLELCAERRFRSLHAEPLIAAAS